MTPARVVWSWLSPADRWGMVAAGVVAGVAAGWLRGWQFAPDVAGLGALAFAVLRIDGARFVIPDLLNIGIGALGLVDSVLAGAAIWPRLAVMAGLGLAMLGLRWAMSRWRGASALGLGDVKLLVASAAWLPGAALSPFVFIAALSGLAESLIRRRPGGRIAFGQHLAPWLVICVIGAEWLPKAG